MNPAVGPAVGSPSDQAAHLYLLTLALESALIREDWAESKSLFNERAQAIARLDSLDHAAFTRIQAVEFRISARLHARREQVLVQMRRGLRVDKARKLYGSAAVADAASN